VTALRPNRYPLGLAEFQRLAAFLLERAGLVFEEQAHYLFERRLGERVEALGLPHFQSYVDRVLYDSEEQEMLFELLTTKETYFNRQDYQFDAFMEHVLPKLALANAEHKRLTIWSAGCSSGEEAYTLAMLLSESPLVRGYNVQVLGTDLCRSNIEAARRAEYRKSSFRVLSDERVAKYFERTDGGYRVQSALRRMCHFSKVNLLDKSEVRTVGRVDAIFCRNVLIYFGEQARREVTSHLFERLLPGGYLLLGHTESLINMKTDFDIVHLDNDVVYRRPSGHRSQSSDGGRS
jgi:chemotaxis protein methyltransferase CheR